VVLAAVLLLTGWAVHRYRFNSAAVLGFRLVAVLLFLSSIYLALIRPLFKRISDARLARLIEEATPGAEDRLVTAVEYGEYERQRTISPAIINRLQSDANDFSSTLNLGNIIRRSRLLTYGIAAFASLLIFAGVLKWGPREISEGVAQLVTPTTLAASKNSLSIKVRPGTARVPKGSDQDILATLVNFESQTVTVYSRPLGSKDDFQGQTMEPGKARNDFRFSIFNIQDSVEYFVESNSVKSETYKLNVVDLPYVKQLDLVLNFPSFTRMPAKVLEDGGDIAALKGTAVKITAQLSGKVRAARIVFPDGRKTDMKAEGSNFVGELSVSANSSYYIELVSVDGESYRGSNEYDITVLDDQPPSISFDKPGRDRKATNLEEVFTQARAEDDYGVLAMDLHFSVNGGAEKKVGLQQLTQESARSLTGTYTFFLEEYGLKPGDFISYYAKARDANSEVTSDIYFIEVKPFEMEYRQSQQQGGGGGGQGDQDQNALSRRQKDLIAATHRLIREGEKYTEQERKDGYAAVATGQEKLRTDTLEFLERMNRRLGGDLDSQKQVAEMAENLRQAAKEMEGATPPLQREAGRDALPPEQRSLQKLLAADAIFREVQVAFGNQSGDGGSGQQREQQELAGLFELELDKMKNQYETVQRAQRQQAEQQKSEAERRLEELARRQEQALEEQRRRAQQGAANSSGGGNQRQQQELIEETRKAARELERLSRERRDAQMQELARQLNQTADEMQKAQASSRTNQNDSISQNERALDRLRQAQERLQQMNGSQGGQQNARGGQSGRQQEVSELRQRAAQAAARQREIAKDMEDLARRGGQNGQDENSRRAREQLAERKDTLADSVNSLQQDLEASARGMGQQRAGRQLKDAADSIARDRVAERIKEGKQNLGNQSGNARNEERAIERSLNNLSERLQAAEQSARGANGSSAEEALDRTRQLADNLDSLRRRLDEMNRQRGNQNGQQQGQQQNGQQPGQQQGQQGQRGQQSQQQGQQGQEGQQGQRGQSGQSGQQGQQQGQQGQEGQRGQQSGQQQGQQQGGSPNGSPGGPQGNRYGGAWGTSGNDYWDPRQAPAEIRERLREAQDLRREWGTTSGSPRQLDEAIEELRRLADGRMEGDAATAALLKADVIEPLRQLELELSKKVNQSARTNLRLRDEGAAPDKYKKAVEEYYRRLSGARPK
jgi:hypothetical protein